MVQSPPPSHQPCFTLDIYLFGVRGGLQGAAVVLGVHHGHVGAAVIQHLLHAVYAAALAACADRGAGDRVVAPQAVHLAAGCFTVLHLRIHRSMQLCTNKNSHRFFLPSRPMLLKTVLLYTVTSTQGK